MVLVFAPPVSIVCNYVSIIVIVIISIIRFMLNGIRVCPASVGTQHSGETETYEATSPTGTTCS